VIEQEAAAADEGATTPTATNIAATTITPRRNFDLNKLLINFFLLRH
jgi:hypothetical protein